MKKISLVRLKENRNKKITPQSPLLLIYELLHLLRRKRDEQKEERLEIKIR